MRSESPQPNVAPLLFSTLILRNWRSRVKLFIVLGLSPIPVDVAMRKIHDWTPIFAYERAAEFG